MSGKVPLGWREWLALPDLGVQAIKTKIDTGARTSALHVTALRLQQSAERCYAHFQLNASPQPQAMVLDCRVEVVDLRWIRDSGGHKELRPIILTIAELGQQRWPVEVSLTNRDTQLFPMLLGRTALRGRFIVDPQRSFMQGPGPLLVPVDD